MYINVRHIVFSILFFISAMSMAAKAVFIITPLQKAPAIIYAGQTVEAVYQIRNNTPYPLNNNGLVDLPPGVTQQGGDCATPYFNLAVGASCTIRLQIKADALLDSISGGPVICNTPNHRIYCSNPSSGNELSIVKSTNPPPSTEATITVSPLSLSFVVGSLGTVTVTNDSSTSAVQNLAVTIAAGSSIAVDASSSCIIGGMLAPSSSCSLIFTATAVANNISVLIKGDNTNSSVVLITVNPRRPMVAVGAYTTQQGDIKPLSYFSIDGGISWNLSSFTSQAPVGQLRGVACDSSGLSCVAVGISGTLGAASAASYISTDGGQNWALSANQPPPPPTSAQVVIMQEAFCDTSGLKCVVAASYFDTTQDPFRQYPFSYVSADGGQSWTDSTPLAPPGSAITYSISCDNSATYCAMIGQTLDSLLEPVSYFSMNGGIIWLPSTMPADLSAVTYPVSLFCAAETSSTACVAVGWSGTSAINYRSTDRGANWTLVNSIPGGFSQLYGVSCDKSATRCVAVGNSSGPISFTTNDSGVTWQLSNAVPPALDSSAHLEKVFCDESGTNCTVIGWYGIQSAPYTAVTANGGNNWSLSTTLPPLPQDAASAQLYAVNGQLSQ